MGLISKLFAVTPRKMPVHVTDENFREEVLESELPVLLDVWGPDCVPCQQLAPVIMALAARYDGRVKVAELNASESPRTARRLGVQGTPTVVYLRRGHEVERTVGFRGQRWHEEIIETEMLGAPAAAPVPRGTVRR